jgi:integral membrane protein
MHGGLRSTHNRQGDCPVTPIPNDPDLRRLGAVATAETISFAVLLVGSVLKRTTEFDPVPVLGSVHGALFLGLVVGLALSWRRLGWSPLFWLATATVLSPGAHWIVAAERRKRQAYQGA